MDYNRKRNNIRFVLNNDNDGINKKELNHYLGIKPDLSIPRLPEEWIYRAAYKKRKCLIRYPSIKIHLMIYLTQSIKKLCQMGFIKREKEGESCSKQTTDQ